MTHHDHDHEPNTQGVPSDDGTDDDAASGGAPEPPDGPQAPGAPGSPEGPPSTTDDDGTPVENPAG